MVICNMWVEGNLFSNMAFKDLSKKVVIVYGFPCDVFQDVRYALCVIMVMSDGVWKLLP